MHDEQHNDFGYATLDTQQEDITAKGNTGKGGVGITSIFQQTSNSTESQWLWPLGLIGAWITIYALVAIISGTSPHALRYWPVVLGNATQIKLIKFLSILNAHVAGTHTITSFIVWPFMRLITFVTMFVCSICASFMHASIGHLVGNILLFVLLLLMLAFMNVPFSIAVKNWLYGTTFGIFGVWIITRILGTITLFFLPKLQWLHAVLNSTTPIIGASVGIYAVLGFTLVQAIKSTRKSSWFYVPTIITFVLSLGLCYQRYIDGFISGHYNSIQAALLLGACMHFVGLAIGLIRGFQMPTEN